MIREKVMTNIRYIMRKLCIVSFLLADELDIVGAGMDKFELQGASKTFVKSIWRLEAA